MFDTKSTYDMVWMCGCGCGFAYSNVRWFTVFSLKFFFFRDFNNYKNSILQKLLHIYKLHI